MMDGFRGLTLPKFNKHRPWKVSYRDPIKKKANVFLSHHFFKEFPVFRFGGVVIPVTIWIYHPPSVGWYSRSPEKSGGGGLGVVGWLLQRETRVLDQSHHFNLNKTADISQMLHGTGMKYYLPIQECHKFKPNVGKDFIHWAYGYCMDIHSL